MKIALLEQHEKYNRQDVIEIHDQDFIDHNTDWGTNPPPNGVQLEDNSPVEVGWKRRGDEWESPETTHVDDARVDKKAEIAEARWLEETGGIVVGGVPIVTDDRSKSLLKAAYDEAKEDPNFRDGWKGADGVFRMVDAPTIIAVYDALKNHVRTCFAREAQLTAQIDAVTDDMPDPVERVQAIHWEL